MKIEQYNEGTQYIKKLISLFDDATEGKHHLTRNKSTFSTTATMCALPCYAEAACDGAVFTIVEQRNGMMADEMRFIIPVDVFYLRDNDVMTCVGYQYIYPSMDCSEEQAEQVGTYLTDNVFARNTLDCSNNINGTLIHARGHIGVDVCENIHWCDELVLSRVNSSVVRDLAIPHDYVCAVRRFSDRIPTGRDVTIHNAEMTMIGLWNDQGDYVFDTLKLDGQVSKGDMVLLKRIIESHHSVIVNTIVPQRNSGWTYTVIFNLMYWQMDDNAGMYKLTGAAAYSASRPCSETPMENDAIVINLSLMGDKA